jgi:hypothetical protein
MPSPCAMLFFATNPSLWKGDSFCRSRRARPPRRPWTRQSSGGTLWLMKRHKKTPVDLVQRFQTTCGWCGRSILPGTEVFGGGGKARPGIDLTAQAGQVLQVHLVGPDKMVLIAVAGLDSDARRDGHDFVYMTCSEACAHSLKTAFESEIEMGKRLGLS